MLINNQTLPICLLSRLRDKILGNSEMDTKNKDQQSSITLKCINRISTSSKNKFNALILQSSTTSKPQLSEMIWKPLKREILNQLKKSIHCQKYRSTRILKTKNSANVHHLQERDVEEREKEMTSTSSRPKRELSNLEELSVRLRRMDLQLSKDRDWGIKWVHNKAGLRERRNLCIFIPR